MKRVLGFLLLLTLVISGCKTASPAGGNISAEDESFQLIAPGRTVEIKQGEIVTVPLEIKRGKFFKQDVTLQIQGSEQIRIDPQNVTIRASELPTVNVRLAAPAQAALGGYVINVTATPQNGRATSAQLQVTVTAQQLR